MRGPVLHIPHFTNFSGGNIFVYIGLFDFILHIHHFTNFSGGNIFVSRGIKNFINFLFRRERNLLASEKFDNCIGYIIINIYSSILNYIIYIIYYRLTGTLGLFL